jgi:hypothetical protein
LRDLFLEARAQLAHVRMAAMWLDEQVAEHLGQFEQSASDAEFFRQALHPALSGAIVLAVFSLLEQAIQRIGERHAAWDKKGGKLWAKVPGNGALRAITYLHKVGGEALVGPLRDFDDLRLVRNQLAHRGSDFSSAPEKTLAAARRHGVLDGVRADPHRVLGWMLTLEAQLLDALEAELVR